MSADNYMFHCLSPKGRAMTIYVLAETMAQARALLESKGFSRVHNIGIDNDFPWDFNATLSTRADR